MALVLLVELLGLALGYVALCDPLGCFDHLDHVDDLLAEHDWEGDGGEDPWDGAVHLVRPARC